jgi:hypothetical protein
MNRPADIRAMVQTLMLRAGPHLTADELKSLGQLDDQARVLASNASTVAEGIACIVAFDGQTTVGAGNFQRAGEVASLLVVFAGVFDAIAGMIDAADLARDQQKRGAAS